MDEEDLAELRESQIMTGIYNAAAVPERNGRTSRLCYPSRPRTEGTTVTVSQPFVVIHIVGAWCRFSIPEIIQGWKPDPRRVWQKDTNVDKVAASATSVLGKRKLTANQVVSRLFIPTQY
jgi:hypothetical protein